MKLPDFSYEKKIWSKGYKMVAGADEVGRGCLAGPVVAGCVAFGQKSEIPGSIENIRIDDSKKLSSQQREKADKWIRENSYAYGIGSASVAQINKFGIKKASEIAFRKAIKNCGRINYLLIDAFYVPYVKGLRRKNQMPIIDGDAKSFSIAAASIIAKVERDSLMMRLSQNPKYKKYHWYKCKGYGTKDHRQSIIKYGITRHHRKLFVRSLI